MQDQPVNKLFHADGLLTGEMVKKTLVISGLLVVLVLTMDIINAQNQPHM